jgi:hypothetical protein
MHLFKSLPLSVVLLIADAPSSSATLMPRAFEKMHGIAMKHTRGLARDLRVAFGGVLVAQPNEHQSQHVIYCKPGRSGGLPSPGSGGGGNNTSSTSPTSSTSRPSGGTKSTTTSVGASNTGVPVPPSPWKLVETHVSSSNWALDFLR